MSGLSRFVDYSKTQFIGRDAALIDRDRPPARRLVTLKVVASDAEASFYEPIWDGPTLAGFVTSGGFAHCYGHSLAMGYVNTAAAVPGAELAVTVLGERRPCQVLGEPAIDPNGSRMRM